MQHQKVDYQLLRKSGLFSEDQQGELRDRFIERIMYPIKNGQGQVIAFSGRLIDTSKTNLPKYLNSPETPIFNKRRTLFNFDVARKASRFADQEHSLNQIVQSAPHSFPVFLNN